METYAERARLALLIALQTASNNFADPGAMAILHWYEEFCVSKGKHTLECLDLSGMDLKILPDFITLPLSFGVSSVKLMDNPGLTDVTALQAMPRRIKIMTIGFSIPENTKSPDSQLLDNIIYRRDKQKSSTEKLAIDLNLEDFDRISIYIQFCPKIKYLKLSECRKITDLSPLKNLTKIKYLTLSNPSDSLNIKTLKQHTTLKNLRIEKFYCGRILEDLENFINLRRVVLFSSNVSNIESLCKLPKLIELELRMNNDIIEIHLNNKFKSIQKLFIFRTKNLKKIIIDNVCLSLKYIFIDTAFKLEVIDGINHLPNLEQIEIESSGCLRKITGIENIKKLKNIYFSGFDLDFLKTTLKSQISSGEYKIFKKTRNLFPSIHNIEPRKTHHKLIHRALIDLRLLEHQLSSAFPVADNFIEVNKSLEIIHHPRINKAVDLSKIY